MLAQPQAGHCKVGFADGIPISTSQVTAQCLPRPQAVLFRLSDVPHGTQADTPLQSGSNQASASQNTAFFFSSALLCCRPEPSSRLGFGASSLTLALGLLTVHMGHRPSGHLAANSAKVFYDGVPWLPCQELRKRFFPASLFPLPIITVAVFSVLLFLICKLSLTERAVQTLWVSLL